MKRDEKFVVNPMVVLREEFDDWALLFDPDTNEIFTVDPVGVYVWKRLDGKHTSADILKELQVNCEDVPQDGARHINKFIKELTKRGLAGYEVRKG